MHSTENNFVILISLKTFEEKIIRLPKGMESVSFSPIYLWTENFIILTTYRSKILYKISFEDNSIKIISELELKISNDLFYQFWKKAMKYVKFGENLCCFSDIIRAYPEELQFIVNNYVKEKISFIDFINNKTINAPDTIQKNMMYFIGVVFLFLFKKTKLTFLKIISLKP